MMKLASSILLSFAIASVACACNIPVFRYALERWQPDRCEVIVFHKGGLTAEQERLLAKLGAEATGKDRSNFGARPESGLGARPESGLGARPESGLGARPESGQYANVKIVKSDISRATEVHAALWTQIESDTGATLPYVVLRTKLGYGKVVNGWHGPLDAIGHSAVFDSPIRKELGRRLLAGHSIVWLMIGSGDEPQNMAVRQMLTENFDSLAEKIELPEGIGLPGSELHSEIPLLLKYSLLEIDRADLREQFLIQLLSGFQPEAVAQGEPLIVPVFGRGRALEVIPANDLSVRLMEDLTVFLSGACSCQVKEQNPGFDLLLSVDWDTELFGEGVEPPQARTTRDRQQPTLLTIPPGR